jgi:hypothetical protein
MERLTRSGMMAAAAVMVAGITGLYVARVGATGHGNNDEHHRECSAATLRGDYGIQIQGTRPSAPGGPIEAVIGVVLRRYDGVSQFTQIDNVKGAISGITPNRFGSGSYQVNADCTAVVTAVPGPGILLEEQLVIVNDGREVRSIVASPPPVMVTGVQRKIE